MEDKGYRISLQFSADDEDAIRTCEFLKLLGRKKSSFITDLVVKYLDSDEAKGYLLRSLLSEKEKNKEKRRVASNNKPPKKKSTPIAKEEKNVQYEDINDDGPTFSDSEKRERRMAGLAMFTK